MSPINSTNNSTLQFEEPVAIHRNIPEIFQIFHNVQFNTVQHKKYIKELKKVFHKIDADAFNESFTNALHYLFIFGEANGNVDRIMQFVANFCGALSEEEEFLHFIFGVVFDCASVSGQGVRSRACQLLGLILSALGDDASLDDDLCGKILSTQLERLQDVRGAVRCRAVLALHRLQNPGDDNDPVTSAYTFHMSCDPSAAVRRAVVLGIGKSSRNLLHVLERLCDVDESVRKAAFLYVASFNVTQLKVRQRIHILKVGLTERSPRVRRVVETALLPGWLGAYGGSVLELLAAVRLDNLQGARDSATVAANLLQSLFKHQQMTELLEWLPVDRKIKLIPPEQLSKESAWYWRHLVKHLHSIEDTDHLEEVLPELVIYTGYVRAIVESPCPDPVEKPVEFSRRQYVLQELISIFPVYDMADEVGRGALQTLLYDTLTGNHGPLDPEVIQATVRAIDLVLPDVKKRIEFVAGIISEIHEPGDNLEPPPPPTPLESIETKIMRAQLRVALNEAQEEQEDAVRIKDFVLAAECKEKVDSIQKKLSELNSLKEVPVPQPVPEVIREKKNDSVTLNKCLLILNKLLDTPDINSLTPVLRSLFQNFEDVLYHNIEIRDNALQTVALYSMLDEEFAKEQKSFFFAQFMDMDNEQILITALKCVIDIICIYGVKLFNITPDAEEKDKEAEEEEDEDEYDIFIDKSKRKSKAADKSKRRNTTTSKVTDTEDGEENKTLTPSSTHDTIIEIFLTLMSSECAEYRAVVVEGLCRLLSAGRLCSSSLISRLLLLWFNPATEEEDGLKQILGTFFPVFAANTDGAQEQLEEAFLPTLVTLANAPLSSPLAEVEHETVLRFMIGLTLPSVAPLAHSVHPNLALRIMNALERDAGEATPLLCRALALLSPPRAPQLCRDLLCSTNYILESLTDKTSYRNISKFQATLAITLENLEQRTSAANPPLETLTEVSETSKTSIDPDSDPVSEKQTIESPNTGAVDTPPTVDSDEVEIESVPSSGNSDVAFSTSSTSSPPKKMKRLTAADVAKRALRKTPRTVTKKQTESPLAAKTPKQNENTSPGLRRSARTTPARSRSARGLQQQLDAVAVNEKTPLQGKGKQPKKTTAKTPAKPPPKPPAKPTAARNTKRKAPISPKATPSTPNSPSSPPNKSARRSTRSSGAFSEQSSDDETILHTICHEEYQAMSIMNNSSSDEEEDNRKDRQTRNVTVPETPETSDQSDSDDEEEPIPVSQNKKKAACSARKK